jgi:cytochrome c-type biogenesis protein
VLGFSILFVSYGAAFGGLGELLPAHQQVLIRVLGAVTIVLGLLVAWKVRCPLGRIALEPKGN